MTLPPAKKKRSLARAYAAYARGQDLAQARRALLVAAVLKALFAVILVSSFPRGTSFGPRLLEALPRELLPGLIFLAFAFWARYRPLPAILLGLVFFLTNEAVILVFAQVQALIPALVPVKMALAVFLFLAIKPALADEQSRRPSPGTFGDLRDAIIFYILLLVLVVLVQVLLRVGPPAPGAAFRLLLGYALAAALLIGGWLAGHRRLAAPALKKVGFSWWGYPLVVLAAPLVFAAGTLIHYLLLRLAGGEWNAGRELVPADWSFFQALTVYVLFPALFEELAFRGYLWGALERVLRPGLVWIITSLMFFFLHLNTLSLGLVVLAFYLGWLRRRSASVWPPVLAHALHNLLFLALVFWEPLRRYFA